MANVGSLTVSLTALTGRFSSGMKSAVKDVVGFGKSVKEMVHTLGDARNAVKGIGEAFDRLKAPMENIDKTAKVADRLGATTEELIGMRHAANLAGVGADELDKALEKLSKNLGDPSKEVADALDKIGLSSIALLNMSPGERFAKIADGINKLGTQGEKAAVATALFGKTGADLLNTLELGSAGLRDATEETKKLGTAFSRIDAAQVEEANDSVTKLHSAFDGLLQKLSFKVAPFITELANDFIGLGTDGTSVADSIADGAVGIARSLLRVVDIVDLLRSAFFALGGVGLKVQSFWESWGATVKKNVADWVNVLSPGTIDDATLQDEMKTLMDHIAEVDANAIKAFAESRKSLADAISGARSGDARAGFDRIINASRARAVKTVTDQSNARTQASVAARVKTGEDLARGFTSFLKSAGKFGQQVLDTGNGSALVADAMKSVSAFFSSLPERAVRAGYMPVDYQTTVRGTYSGETATRQTSTMTVQTKQLELSRQMLDQLQGIRASVAGGIALP
jgi:hypothetical protein